MSLKTRAPACLGVHAMADLFTDEIAPRDIAVLNGLPRDAAAFLRDLDLRRQQPTDGRGDFASLQVPQFSTSAERDALARRHAKLVDSLLSTASASGISPSRIFEEADLDALAAAFESGARVVVLVAHWRSCWFSKSDFAPDIWPQVSARLVNNDQAIARALSDHLSSIDEEASPSAGHLSDLFNEFVTALGSEDDQGIVRDALDVFLRGCVAPGNGLELRDGIHKSSLLASIIPSDWSGVVDLGVCESFDLAQAIKAGRQDRRVLTNKKAKLLDRIIPELREVLLSLSTTPGPYIPLKAHTHITYTDLITETRS